MESFCQLWDRRNGRVHGVDTITRAKIQKEKAHHKLLALYVLRDQTWHCDRDIYYNTAQDHLNARNVGALKSWLRVYQPLIKHSIKEAARLAIHNMCTLHSSSGRRRYKTNFASSLPFMGRDVNLPSPGNSDSVTGNNRY
jgi:hypothetical protein